MALDNPSYFSVATGRNEDFLKSKMSSSIDTHSTSSESSINKSPMRLPRSYLRSISTNSADSNQELLIMGEPRLSDIAPDLTFKLPGEPRRANSLKFTRTDQKGQYFPLPNSEVIDVDDQEDEEVFLTESTATYYNLSQNPVNRRRHSIGTMMARERSLSATCPSPNFKDDFPHVVVHTTPDGNSIGPINSIVLDDHSMRHSSYPRKRCLRCKVPNKKLTEMDDILIISVKSNETASMWANYFTTCFQQFGYHQITKRSFKIHHIDLDEIIEANGDLRFILEKTVTVKLQLVVICPLFLDRLNKNLAKITPLSKFLSTNRVLALLLGVDDADITESHKTVLTTYTQWQRHTVGEDQDESFTKEFLGSAMMIYMRAWKQQVSLSNQEKSHFSVSPKKVRQGQNSVLIVLTHPLQKEDIVKISIERNNEIVEIKSFKVRNPYTLKISIPEVMTEVSAIVNVLVEKNGSIIGSRPIKCESKLRELEQILRSTSNPVEFMCQTMGFSTQDKCQLDNLMVHTFQKNLPPNFNVLSSLRPIDRIRQAGCEQFPTLLHFAAKYDLKKFAMQLIECPGGDMACEIKNVTDCNPSDIAEAEGYSELAQMLRGYMKINEFSKMYTTLKQISLNPESIDEVDEDDYLVPREANFYKLCPAPRPVISPVTTPLSDISQDALNSQYMSMTSNKQNQTSQDSVQKVKEQRAPSVQRLTSATSSSNISVTSSVKSTATSTAQEDKVQQELLEIINDFKKDIHSIEQTEKLVQQWKKRNDVQKSYKEKMDQLNDMRKQYEEIQQLLKVERKPSPFERIGKFFSRRKQKSVKQSEKDSVLLHPITNRPISSLSIQSTSSSGSSGRMSTISGCSLGDSGTHSDHEDRKNLIGSVCDDDFRQMDMLRKMKESNYLIPPAPKPVLPTQTRSLSTSVIDERPPQPTPRDVTEYYIQFPPSGLPVQQFHQNQQEPLSNVTETPEDNVYVQFEEQSQDASPTAEYMNFSPLAKQQSFDREYMNLAPANNQHNKQHNAQSSNNLPEYMNLTPQK